MSSPQPALQYGPMALMQVIRNTFVTAMRTAFATDATYPYVSMPDGRTNFDSTAIEIIDTTPLETTKYPAIIVRSLSGRGTSISFDNDFLRENRDADGNVISEDYGNQFPASVDVEVWSYDSISRDELVDKEYLYLKTVKNVFAEAGIEIRNVELITPREEQIGTRVLFISGLSIGTYSEWNVTRTIQSDELISKFAVTISTQFNRI